MLTIFEFTNYRDYLVKWIESQGARAYGLKGRISEALGISSSLLSQILKEEKSFTSDQASDLADFIGLNELESDYLFLLIEQDRAANPRYREKLGRKIKALQQQSQKIGKRVPRNKELSDEQKAIYYSSWLYTGVRNLSAIPEMDQAEPIAERLQCDPLLIKKVLRFLLENGLCKEEGGKITYGPASIHIDRESPFVNKHHQNWRFQAIHKMEQQKPSDVFFTSPMSISKSAAEEIQKLLPTFIQSAIKIAGPSDSEVVRCLNIDWFEY